MNQARKRNPNPKGPKPKLLSPDIFWWGGGLPLEGVGAEKFGMSLETTETKLFCREIPGFCWDIRAVPEKLEKKKVCVQFWAPKEHQLGIFHLSHRPNRSLKKVSLPEREKGLEDQSSLITLILLAFFGSAFFLLSFCEFPCSFGGCLRFRFQDFSRRPG